MLISVTVIMAALYGLIEALAIRRVQLSEQGPR